MDFFHLASTDTNGQVSKRFGLDWSGIFHFLDNLPSPEISLQNRHVLAASFCGKFRELYSARTEPE
jgi:hypothetical protein